MNLSITPTLPVLSVQANEAREVRDQLLRQAQDVQKITDRLDADDATQVLKSLAGFEREIEDARTLAKAPVLEISRKIDALGKELMAKVTEEKGRISRAIGAFESEERRKAEDARRKLEIEALRVSREAEAQALKACKEAKTEADRDLKVDAIVEKAQADVVQIKAQVANLAPKKAEGSKLLKQVKFEVLDIQQLFKARPEFCTIEPNNAVIKAMLKSNPNLQVPGLRSWIEESLSV